LGIHGFEQGGFLLEAGKLPDQAVGCLIARAEMPHDWRWVLVRPLRQEGISGTAEMSAFGQLPPMSSSLTNALCGLAVRTIFPAIQEQDFLRFSLGLWEYGQLVGEYFAPVQGGVFADSQMRLLAAALKERGVLGIAQTSWGPTLAVIQPHQAAAAELMDWIRHSSSGQQCEVTCTRSLNDGASFRVMSEVR
jgi:predicted sugar kinase